LILLSQAVFHATIESGVASDRMIGIALALIAIVAAVFVFNSRGAENKAMPGQSLIDKSTAAQKLPIRAPSPTMVSCACLPKRFRYLSSISIVNRSMRVVIISEIRG
jgi:hypothetical protein